MNTYLLYAVLGIAGVLGYFMKNFIEETVLRRLDNLEDNVRTAITEDAVRRILDDQINPLREDIKEIKDMLNKMTHEQ